MPRVEALEDRAVPAAAVTQSGNLITITGMGNSNNNITITDNGLNSAGAILISGTIASGTFTSTAVTAGSPIIISIVTKNGKDNITYNVTGSFNRVTPGSNPATATSATGGRIINAILGGGDDSFLFSGNDPGETFPDPGQTGPANGGPRFGPRGFDVVNAQLLVTVNGGSGDDRIGINYAGDIRNGNVNLVAFGGADDDQVYINESISALNNSSTNTALVSGGAGQNTLGLTLYANQYFAGPAPTFLPTQYTGRKGTLQGNGQSKAVATSNVIVNSVKAINLVQF